MANALIGMVSLQHKDSQQSRHDVRQKKVLQKTTARGLFAVGVRTFTDLFQPPAGGTHRVEKGKEHAGLTRVTFSETRWQGSSFFLLERRDGCLRTRAGHGKSERFQRSEPKYRWRCKEAGRHEQPGGKRRQEMTIGRFRFECSV